MREQERYEDTHTPQRDNDADEKMGCLGRLAVWVLTKIFQLIAVVLFFLLMVWLLHGANGMPVIP